MLDIRVVREDPDEVRRSVLRRNLDPSRADVDGLIAADEAWRKGRGVVDELRAERNRLSQEIGKLPPEERAAAGARSKELKKQLAEAEAEVERNAAIRDRILRTLPNLILADVPDGKGEEDNVEVGRWGEPKDFGFPPKDHVEIGRLTDTIDFERGAKVTGSSFYYLKREAVLLEQALLAFVARKLVPRGFVPIVTPDLARDEILDGIGFSPRGPETQVYSIEGSDLSLVGTAEITVGGYHSGEMLEVDRLPIRYLGFSHCFRTEAGAHGRESRGLYRVHQFTKAEMFVLCRPEDSVDLHEEIRGIEEEILRELSIPYRVVNCCTGDLGAPAAKKYDIEAWMPGRSRYGEVTSCSNCTDYQARRLDVRYRPGPGESPRHVHLLNGTAVAISRTLIAIYENGQREDGSVTIPEALRPFVGGLDVVPVR